MRFRPEQHLRRQSDIRAVREQGRRVECRAFTIWWKRRSPPAVATGEAPDAPPSEKLPDVRVCVIASTAAVGNAVQRNHAKRRLREIFREQQAAVPAGCDLLLIARKAVNEWPMAELGQKFGEACRAIRPADGKALA